MENFTKNENTSKKMFLLLPADYTNDFKKDLKREVVKKQTSDYGLHYHLKCGWYASWNNLYRRWTIDTLSTAKFVALYTNKEDVKEIIE